MLAYLMLFAALCNVVCLYDAFFVLIFVIMLCLGLLTHSLFISSMIFHHAQAINLLVFSKIYVHTIFYMKGLCAFWRNST